MSAYYFCKRAFHFAKRLLGVKYTADRYAPLFREIAAMKPRSILEIGTHDGLNAVRMMRLTKGHYYGCDLFERLDNNTFLAEASLRPPRRSAVRRRLERSGLDFTLVPGDTRVTLRHGGLPPMDLIFIDGGHSEETVASDWANCQRLMKDRTVVYFDDYPNWGIGPVVDGIDRSKYDVQIMPEVDYYPDQFTGGGILEFHLARVTLRRPSQPSS